MVMTIEERKKAATDSTRRWQIKKGPRYQRDQNLRFKYGITLEEWERAFDDQGHACKICGTTEPGGKGWQTDHTTNHLEEIIVRGILCHACNISIHGQHTPEVLRRMADYVETFGALGVIQ